MVGYKPNRSFIRLFHCLPLYSVIVLMSLMALCVSLFRSVLGLAKHLGRKWVNLISACHWLLANWVLPLTLCSCVYILTVDHHVNMKLIVAMAIERLLHRPNIGQKAQ